ncbi:MAG: sigma-54-dependent transcriptional regulator [Opitutales bacterium]
MALDRILVVDDEAAIRQSMAGHLQHKRYKVAVAPDVATAAGYLKKDTFDLVFLDENLPDGPGSQLMRRVLKEQQPAPFIIMMSGFATLHGAIECMREGAFDYLLKPFSLEQVDVALERAENYDQLVQVNAYYREELRGESTLIGSSACMKGLTQMVRKVAATEATVLVTGENGTGKELVAQELYRQSPRRQGPFIRVNCAAMTESLIESEFFGHEKGAYTGAMQRRHGRFELADKGTILLDEIGEISPKMQVKLLRVLQEREFERVGGTKTISVDVRVVATTNRDLLKLVQQGHFREDLYYRLNVFPLQVPPLRERGEDILLLAEHFTGIFSRRHGKKLRGLSGAARAKLAAHPWPGNVRELQNTIERAAILSEPGQLIAPENLLLTPSMASAGAMHPAPSAEHSDAGGPPLDPPVSARLATAPVPVSPTPAPLHADTEGQRKSLADLEREHILRVLEMTGWNRAEAADILEVTTRTLRNKLRQYREMGIIATDD